jgi:hypothetical protein
MTTITTVVAVITMHPMHPMTFCRAGRGILFRLRLRLLLPRTFPRSALNPRSTGSFGHMPVGDHLTISYISKPWFC